MYCISNHSIKTTCGCQSHFTNTLQFWSKEKKIRILENHLLCIEEQARDIRDALNELKQ